MRNLEDILIQSKMVMNKVDSGDYQSGNIDRNIISKSADELVEAYGKNPTMQQQQQLPQVAQYVDVNTNAYKSKVNESRLPDSIKALMLENPIASPDVPLENTLDLSFTNRVAEKMKKMDMMDNPKLMKGNLKEQPQRQQQQRQQQQQAPQQAQQQAQNSGGVMGISEAALRELKPLIEHIVESSIEKILEKRLNEQETKASKMDESLVIRVGDYIFTGKITGSKPVKK